MKKNKGSHGIDKMGVDELLPYLRSHGKELKQSIADGSYRLNRSAHQAILKCKEYMDEGYRWAVDIDLEKDLKLKVNKEKSKIDRPWKLKYLGYTYYTKKGEMGMRVHQASIKKLKGKFKSITARSNAMSMELRAVKLKQPIVGWIGYFKLADMKSTLRELDEWLRRRLRLCYWKQWKKIKTKHDNLVKLGVENWKAWEYANTRKGYWRISNSPIFATTLTNKYLREQGFITLNERYSQVR